MSIVEVLIALFFLSLITVPFLALLTQSSTALFLSGNNTKVHSYALSLLEAVKAESQDLELQDLKGQEFKPEEIVPRFKVSEDLKARITFKARVESSNLIELIVEVECDYTKPKKTVQIYTIIRDSKNGVQ